MDIQNKDKKMQRLVIVTMKDNGEKIYVKCGDIIQIELEGLGSAGYWWYFYSLETEYFELLSEETRSISENKIGAQVLGVWRVRAKTQRL